MDLLLEMFSLFWPRGQCMWYVENDPNRHGGG